jgi:hypothetical protein
VLLRTSGANGAIHATLPHDLVDLVGAADVVIREAFDVDAVRLVLVNLQVVVLRCVDYERCCRLDELGVRATESSVRKLYTGTRVAHSGRGSAPGIAPARSVDTTTICKDRTCAPYS